ncbi:hypothetical protein EDD15DRAFT_2197242 [Pisolithus albus]|nr:hypothetical protein EDD15DRAFT_2197242 [Pisolithus albus]
MSACPMFCQIISWGIIVADPDIAVMQGLKWTSMITWASNGSTPIEQETFGIESDVKIQNPHMNTGSGKLLQLAHPSCIAAMPTPSLPVEIEWMIFILCAQHKNRLEPIVYRVVHLPSNRVAKKFLQSIGSQYCSLGLQSRSRWQGKFWGSATVSKT